MTRIRGDLPGFVAACALLFMAAGCGSDGPSDDATSPPHGTVATAGDLSDEIGARFEEALVEVMGRYEVPGAVVAVATDEGSWTAEAGVIDLDSREPVSAEMVWPMRSLTKSVVVTVLLQLADEGVLDLDDTVDRYLEGVPDGDRMTLRQLAEMTSGVGDYTQSEVFLEDLIGDVTRSFTLEALNEYGFALGPRFAPGTDRVYSNTAPNVLGVVIEQVTGATIDAVIGERVVDELELTDTVYPSRDQDWPTPHATGHQPSEDGQEPTFNNFSAMGASGAMVSTLDDMAVWVEALGRGTLVSPELQAQRLVGTPLSDGPEYDRYALGIGEVDGWWGHTGEGLGFTSLAMYDSETTSTVVIFMNVSQAVDADGAERHAPTALMRDLAAILAAR